MRTRPPVIALRLYSRPVCHLCDDMKAVVDRVVRSTTVAVAVTEIDISGDPDLEARYGLEIPVLEIDGSRIAKYRVSEAELTRAVAARLPG